MIGITSFGAYIPRFRMNRSTIWGAVGFLGNFPRPGENAVANFDEDSISMAVSAGLDCLRLIDKDDIEGVFFATTTQPFGVRQNSTIVASALNVKSDLRTSDFVACTKAGTSALLSALDAVKADSLNNILVCAADSRIGKPGSAQEYLFGDGATALLVGKDKVIATLECQHSISYDFPDRWKSVGEKFEHTWEDRFIRDEGYSKILVEAISGLLNKCNLEIKDITKLIYPCPYPSEHARIAEKLNAVSGQKQDTMIDKIGETGAAHPLIMLVAALEDAKPGDRLLVAGFGNGCDVLLLRVTESILQMGSSVGVKGSIARRKDLSSYEKYCVFHNSMTVDIGMRGETIPYTAFSLLWRERKKILGLQGSRCKSCGTPQYPAGKICVNPDCRAIGQMEPYGFADKKASVFSYTADNLAPSLCPPAIYGIIDFEGGGRYWFDFTDCDLEDIKVGMSVEMTFRRKYVDEGRGVHGYYWKVIPSHS